MGENQMFLFLIYQASFKELKGHGPNLLNPSNSCYALCKETSVEMINTLIDQLSFVCDHLKDFENENIVSSKSKSENSGKLKTISSADAVKFTPENLSFYIFILLKLWHTHLKELRDNKPDKSKIHRL